MSGSVNVTEQAIATLNNMAAQLQQISEDIHKEVAQLRTVFEENEAGLGAHSGDILSLIEDVESAEDDASKPVLKLVLKLQRAALTRMKHINTNEYTNSKGRSR